MRIMQSKSKRTFFYLPGLSSPGLKKSNYYGCYSSPFTDLKLLSEHFEQTKIAAQFSPQNIGEMYHTQDYIMKYGFTVMKQHVQTTLIHAVVTQLEAYDLEHQTEFSHTLHMYLKYERSQSQTANALNLHRNTLTYRTEKNCGSLFPATLTIRIPV